MAAAWGPIFIHNFICQSYIPYCNVQRMSRPRSAQRVWPSAMEDCHPQCALHGLRMCHALQYGIYLWYVKSSISGARKNYVKSLGAAVMHPQTDYLSAHRRSRSSSCRCTDRQTVPESCTGGSKGKIANTWARSVNWACVDCGQSQLAVVNSCSELAVLWQITWCSAISVLNTNTASLKSTRFLTGSQWSCLKTGVTSSGTDQIACTLSVCWKQTCFIEAAEQSDLFVFMCRA